MKAKAKENYLASGHNACPGCGAAIALRLILRASGKDIIVVSPTGCVETFTSPYDMSAWEVPWVHSLFENAPAVASGIELALKSKGDSTTRVLVIAGDGATFDIGMGSLSGMLERGHEILYICYDNEAYMNTGIQRSSGTPYGASTTTTPIGSCSFGKEQPKKDMIAIANAHKAKYVASATIAYPQDLMRKVKKGLETKGASYLHIAAPCNLGWGFNPEETVELSRLIVETGLFPLVEYENGQLVKAFKIKAIKPIAEYIKKQRRFAHLLSEENADKLEAIQKEADENIEIYDLLRKDAGNDTAV